MNKEYLFENSEQYQFYQARVNSRERLQRNQHIPLDKHQPEIQNPGPLKRDQLWEYKKNQKLSNQNGYSPSFDYPFNSALTSSFDHPYPQNPSNRDFTNQENYFLPSESRLPYQPLSNLNESFSPHPSAYAPRGVIQSDPSEKQRPISGKRLEMEKKRLYAEELKKQIEEKNQIRAARRENPENEGRARFSSADRPNSDIFGQESHARMSEREKKIKYAKELEAQIQQKKFNPSNDRERNDQLFNFEQGLENVADKKKKYAKELEEQIRSKNNENFRENPSFKRRENDENRNRESWNRNYEEPLKNEGNKPEIDKKTLYRLELERQIEDQRKRKEEEKKRKKIEDEIVEVGIFDAKKDLNKHVREPARGRENFEKVKDPFEDLQKNLPNQGFNKFEKKTEIPEPKKDVFEEHPENNFESKKTSQQDLPSQFSKFRPANEILTPFEQEKAAKFQEFMKPAPELIPSNHLFEKIMKEMQDVKKERDQAREQCMEMREMMLKEKEKNLEQMLQMMRNQSNELLNNDPRPAFDRPPVYPVKSMNSLDSRKDLLYDPMRSPNPKHSNDYAQAAYEQVNRKLLMDEEKRFDPYNQNFNSDPRIQKNDLFEKSLAGNSTFIDPSNSKWNNLGNSESSGNDFNPPVQKLRKKWEMNEGENFSENKMMGFEKYSDLNNKRILDQIDEGDESLSGQGTYLGFNDTSKQKIDDEFYREFKKKYIGQERLERDDEAARESREFHGNLDGWMVGSTDDPPSRPIGPELFDKVFGNKADQPDPPSRKDSAKSRKAFSRLNEAKKFTSELDPDLKSELWGASEYITSDPNPEDH